MVRGTSGRKVLQLFGPSQDFSGTEQMVSGVPWEELEQPASLFPHQLPPAQTLLHYCTKQWASERDNSGGPARRQASSLIMNPLNVNRAYVTGFCKKPYVQTVKMKDMTPFSMFISQTWICLGYIPQRRPSLVLHHKYGQGSSLSWVLYEKEDVVTPSSWNPTQAMAVSNKLA